LFVSGLVQCSILFNLCVFARDLSFAYIYKKEDRRVAYLKKHAGKENITDQFLTLYISSSALGYLEKLSRFGPPLTD